MSATRRGFLGMLGALAAGAFVDPVQAASVFVIPQRPLAGFTGLSYMGVPVVTSRYIPGGLEALNEAARDYVRRNSKEIIDNIFAQDALLQQLCGRSSAPLPGRLPRKTIEIMMERFEVGGRR